MGLLDLLKSKSADHSGHIENKKVFDQLVVEAQGDYSNYSLPAFTSLPTYKILTDEPKEKISAFIVDAASFTSASFTKWSLLNSTSYSFNAIWQVGLKLLSSLMRMKLEFSFEQLNKIIRALSPIAASNSFYGDHPCKIFLRPLEDLIAKEGLTDEIKSLLKHMKPSRNDYAELRKIHERIDYLLQGSPKKKYNQADELGAAFEKSFTGMSAADLEKWTALFDVCANTDSKSEPSQKWLSSAEQLVKAIGSAQFSTHLIGWLDVISTILTRIHKSNEDTVTFIHDENHTILKALIWCAGLINEKELNNALETYGFLAYKKKPMHGPLSVRTGTACMCAFALLPMSEGVPRLAKFKMRIKNNSVLKAINKFIRQTAAKNGVNEAEVEEISTPAFGVETGKYTTTIADYRAIYDITADTLLFENNGRQQKTVPASLKESHSVELKKIKATIKEIQSLLPVIENRLERSYLKQKSWSFRNWRERYIDHPLASLISRRLVWHFSKGEMRAQGFLKGNDIVNLREEKIDWLDDETLVQLWHPIGFATHEIIQWREFLEARQIVQPFKQAYREVYLITDAELRTEVYSNRFAAHILRQHQFAALCKQRGWRYQLMGNWDSHNTPFIELPEWNMEAMFFVNSDWQEANTNGMGIFNYISTDQVRFSRAGQPIPLHDVPAMVFTEIMRDVDLFVGVTSIGNDPNWQDGGNQFMNDYWRSYSFSELSQSAIIRSEVLQSLIPRLKIASQCSFEEKFLIVKGKVRTYKIHMGSGNILMEPNDQYLCIVPASSTAAKEKVFLPFEGDNMLSIIISKALLLAADDKITDTTILTQIHQK